MRWHCSPTRLLLLLGLLIASAQLILAQSRAIRPVTIQIPDGEQVELYKGSYALVIGASDYQDNSWGDLSSVREDVKAVREALEEQGFQVDTLLDPTEDALIDEINDFIDAHGYDRENRLLFYYAGHGYTQERNGRKFGYLVPIDAPNPYDNEKAFFRKSLKMEQVLSWAKQIESKHALFVFDSCFSGSVLQSRAAAVPEDISFLTAKPVRQFISAGSANQTVPAISVFRPLFIRGINGHADLDKDGYVTGDELGMYLQKQVPRYQTGQTPQYGKILDPYLDEGNFVFEVENRRGVPTSKVEALQPSKIATLYISEENLFKGMKSSQASWKTKRNSDQDTVYLGNVSNGIPNGKGTFSFPNGEKYVGVTKNGKLHGQGTYTWPDGGKYVGEFSNDMRNGQGTFSFADGRNHVGEFSNDMRNGQGTFSFPDGRTYVGEFKDDKYNGQGTATYPNGDKYVGEFKDDKYNGQGTATFSDGRTYVGEFKDGTYNGQGTWTTPDGMKYVGEFKDGMYNGQGTAIYPNGEKYVGEFKDNKFNGNGSLILPDLHGGSNYVGEFKDSLFNGHGTFYSADGSKYVGEFKNGIPSGNGAMNYSNGSTYIGTWRNGVRDGQGTLTLKDGTILKGKFLDGAFIDETPVGGTKQKIRQLETALDLYRLHNGKYPTTVQKLSALLERPRIGIIPTNWNGPYLRIKKIPVDWWNNEFIYTSDGYVYEIMSLGADGKQGGFGLDADISSNIVR